MSRSIQNTAGHLAAAHPAFSFVNALRDMVTITRQRRALADLPEHLLKDIGVTAQEATEEAGRAAWDVPAHWRG